MRGALNFVARLGLKAAVCLLAVCSLATLAAQSTTDVRQARTIRQAATRAGVPDAVSVPGGPALDRPIHSWSHAVSATELVLAYYEATVGGPLRAVAPRVVRYDRVKKSWKSLELASTCGGSATDVTLGPRWVLVQLHQSPSAALTLILDRDSWTLRGTLAGFQAVERPDGSVVGTASSVHGDPNWTPVPVTWTADGSTSGRC